MPSSIPSSVPTCWGRQGLAELGDFLRLFADKLAFSKCRLLSPLRKVPPGPQSSTGLPLPPSAASLVRVGPCSPGREGWESLPQVCRRPGLEGPRGGGSRAAPACSLTRGDTWFEHVSMLVIMLNCVTLGMFRPCEDVECGSERCNILEAFDAFIFTFFAVEMVIKMVALGLFGQKCYLGDTWNRLDFFIVVAGMMEYSLDGHNVSLSAIRTVRVLRPLRAINRVPSMRILVTLLLDTLPMLGNVLLLCFFVFFIFGIVGVQLWAGLLRNRCFLDSAFVRNNNLTFLRPYYQTEEGEENPFICSSRRDNGMQKCSHIPSRRELRVPCTLGWEAYVQPQAEGVGATRNACINWNQYYNVCRSGDSNPHNGAINFDNIGYAWIAIFQVITLEGWVDIMYYVMDAHSFYNFIYFILLIIVGSFFMINLCLVVIATQFSETKQRESQLMREQRARHLSNDSTLASFSEPGSCYEELLKYVGHIFRKVKRRSLRLYARWQSRWHKKVDPSAVQGQGPGHRQRRAGRHTASVHHLVYHHHHHHHHHYHFSHSSPRRPGPEPGACDTRLVRAGAPPSPPSPGSRPPDAESVHSIYHADCHIEGPQERAQVAHAAATAAASLKLATGLGTMNYPTILPSGMGSGKGSTSPGPKGKWASGPPGTGGHSPLSLNSPDPYEKIQHVVGEHGLGQAPGHLSGLSVPCPLPSPAAGTLTCELKSCPYCTRALEDPEGELSGSESGGSDGRGIYEFTQDVRHGDRRDPMQPPPATDTAGPGSPRRRAQQRAAPGEPGRLGHLWATFSGKLRRIVDSKYFSRGIMMAILVNTLSMGVEYHEQPEELTHALEISNIVFTSMFALEMLLKLLACGPLGYIRNPYNIFDGIIVVISVWEIVGQADGGLSVLRTFRLLRVLKLMRFLPALRRQLVVLVKTMDNVATFCTLLMLFIFIFSILGMHLFGCKFSLKTDTGDTVPDRKNFDSLLWAIVTVFQILTQEDWNVVLYNGMASTSSWAALYFVALMTFGNYVLFNLLVAILVEGFQAEGDANRSDTDEDKTSVHFEEDFHKLRELQTTELKMCSLAVTPNGHLEGRGSLSPPLIMCTAATPMPTPKSSPYLDAAPSLPDSRRGSSSSGDPPLGDQKPLVGAISCASPQAPSCFPNLAPYVSQPHRPRPPRPPGRDGVDTAPTILSRQERVFLSVSNYIFTAIFVAEMMVKVVALGLLSGEHAYLQSSWNLLDGLLVLVSLVDIVVAMASAGGAKILGVLRVLRLLRTLRVISRAPGLKLVVETLISSLRPIGNIVLICCAFFIIFGILGVQLFKGKFYYCEDGDTRNISTKVGRGGLGGQDIAAGAHGWLQRVKWAGSSGWLPGPETVAFSWACGCWESSFHSFTWSDALEHCLYAGLEEGRRGSRCPGRKCSEDNPCEGLSRHATFSNFGMAFLTLFRVSTGDNWNGIMKDTLRECSREDKHCLSYLPALSPVYFVTFVLVAQFVLVNVVVAVLMKHLEESNKEAREDAELDAEIELELAQGPGGARRADADRPPSPQESPDTPNLLVARKVSVSRMLSLPNDSYMFRPVVPASAPHPRPLFDSSPAPDSIASAHSAPAESCASLQIPLAVSSPARSSETLHALSPRGTARSPSLSRLLCRQEAVRADSLEGQIDSPRDTLDPAETGEKTLVRPVSQGGSLQSPPRSPRPASIRTRKHTFGQRCVSSRTAAPGREEAEASDPADEEVSHITSSACPWQPAAEPQGPEASPVAGGERDLRRLYSVDAQGFLDKPGRADEQWRPSAELGSGEPGEAKAWGPEAEPALGARRKKKMSPPCISVEPPAEDEGSARPPAAEGGSTTLRRRTPSCEATPHRDSLEPTEASGTAGDPAAKGERWGQASCRAEHLTVPSFAFEPLDLGGPGGDPFLDGSHSMIPEPRASSSGATVPLEPPETEPPVPVSDPPEKRRGLYLTVPQCPLEKPGSPSATPAPGDGTDDPV
uniref:Ion transport domain-containing protein n=1 Tax=Colobus angolensis palliatus TaxID=336983 RepID=A0A2K5IJG6_COLAP